MQIKNNPFVKNSPTTKTYYLLEKTENLIKIRVLSTARKVPGGEAFSIDEEMVVYMPSNCFNSCVLRVTMQVVWLKFTLLKGPILSGALKEGKTMWNAYSDFVKGNGHFFEEGKQHEVKN